jgi:hypothetical protein
MAALETESEVIAVTGYAAVRQAFNDVLELCVVKLTQADSRLAWEVLDLGGLDEDDTAAIEMLSDTALFSRRDPLRARRAIDRIAGKLPVKRDPLKSAIAARLPAAIFSIFRVIGLHKDGGVHALDLLDRQRPIHIMDHALAQQVQVIGEVLIAGRFVDLGPWYVGFGIVVPLRKSESLAIMLALSASDGGPDEIEEKRHDLHELIYQSHLMGEDLVMRAVEPMISAIAMGIDMEEDFDAAMKSLAPVFPLRRAGGQAENKNANDR